MRALVDRHAREAAAAALKAWAHLVAAARRLASKVRCNAALREHALASATFAGILALGAVGLDYVITGGPDWNPGGAQAYAMEIASPSFVPRSQPHATEAPNLMPPHRSLGFVEIDYSNATEDLLGGPYDVYAAYMADAKNAAIDEANESNEHTIITDVAAPKPS